jgi:predicted MFS family arabinose efflux permease
VAAYALVVAVTQMLWLTFAPIDTDVARDFDVSENAVGWLALVFPLFYVVLALPAGVALDRWFRGSLAVGAGLTGVGALLRLVSQTFAWALAGQAVIAVAQPLVLNAMTKTATGYLPEPRRPVGIAVASAGQFLGAAVGLTMGPLLAGSDDLGPLLPVQAALSVLAVLALLIALRHRPATAGPPAAVGMAELRAVWKVALIRRLAQLAFVGFGVFVALSTWLQPILDHDDISSAAAGAMLAAMLVAGTAGCGILPPIIARASGERAYLIFLVVWACAGFALLAAVHSRIVADFILIIAIGSVLLPALPILLELAERRMGASGGVATGILLLAGNVGGLLVALVVGALSDQPSLAFAVLAACMLGGLPAARRVQPSPRRASGQAAVFIEGRGSARLPRPSVGNPTSPGVVADAKSSTRTARSGAEDLFDATCALFQAGS